MFSVIKRKNAFAVFPESGWILIDPQASNIEAGYGFYHDDTRFVRYLRFEPVHPVDGRALSYAVTRSEQGDDDTHTWELLGDDGWRVRHTSFIESDCWYHRFEVSAASGSGLRPEIRVHARLACEDVFEVRPFLEPWHRVPSDVYALSSDATVWEFAGQDGQTRSIAIGGVSLVQPDWSEGHVSFALSSDDAGIADLRFFADRRDTGSARSLRQPMPYAEALRNLRLAFETFRGRFSLPAQIPEALQGWVRQGLADVFMLQGEVNGLPCLHAGVPWFSALFGRDSLIAAEQLLEVAPQFAQETLAALAAFQAKEADPRFDAQPGKIPHEFRFGERCRLGHVPFGRYYGSVDATPLYVSLAARYLEKTSDVSAIRALKEVLSAAIGWIVTELESKPYLTYRENLAEEGPHGIREKGWKDGAPVLDDDGHQAQHPIALCEVQGYAYRALRDGAYLMEQVEGLTVGAWSPQHLRERADRLRSDFDDAFWMEDLGTYALAIDGRGKPCRIMTSNPGHLLRTGILKSAARVHAVARSLSDPEKLFSGWGIRTLSADDQSFAPDSYQLGGVWPHDTCESLRGLIHVGEMGAARDVYAGLRDLAVACHYRLPELIAGHRRVGDTFVGYSNGCYPQAWAATIPFSLLPSVADLSA